MRACVLVWLVVVLMVPRAVAAQAGPAIESFNLSQGIAYTRHDSEAFSLHIAKGVTVPNPKELAKLGGQALKQLDAWTGQSGLFNPTEPKAEQMVPLYVVSSQQFNAFVKYLRVQGRTDQQHATLYHKYRVCHIGRATIIDRQRFAYHPSLPSHWSINIAANEAMRRFFSAGPGEAEEWLIQGLKAELERTLGPEKTPLITSFDYEDLQDQGPASREWHKDMARLVKEKNPALQKVTMVMAYDIIGLNQIEYKQMWSVCRYVLEMTARGRGDKNRFFQVLSRIQQGELGTKVVPELLKKSEPKLSNAWASWALRLRN